jgi:hypothetical protein
MAFRAVAATSAPIVCAASTAPWSARRAPRKATAKPKAKKAKKKGRKSTAKTGVKAKRSRKRVSGEATTKERNQGAGVKVRF